jgi:hypothetical protein
MNLWKTAVSIACLCLLLTNGYAFPLLTNFQQLVTAVESADEVRAIIHFDKCLLTDAALRTEFSQNLEEATTRINFNRYLHYKPRINDQIRNVVETVDDMVVEQPAGVFLLILRRLTVFEDNTALLHINIFDKTHKTPKLVIDWECDISNGRDDKGLYLFDAS